MPRPQELSESLVKKRARDRRAQQNLRDKRVAYTNTLEQRIAALDSELRSLRQTCYDLKRENEVLRGRQEQIQHIVSSWTRHTPELGSSDIALGSNPGKPETSSLLSEAHPQCSTDGGRHASSTESIPCQIPHENNTVQITQASPSSPRLLKGLTLPQWNMTPVHLDSDSFMTDSFPLCFRRPDLVLSSPETPRPIDLIYGSKRNFLANTIHESTRKWPCRDPERLACGWLTYHTIRWMLYPSEARFSRLLDFQKPVPEQLRHPHPYYVDFIMWPALRANMIKNQCDHEAVAGMLTCCLKVRWPWNKPCLEPADDGQLLFRTDFYDTFTRLAGWGLTSEFLNKYPSLVDGLDTASIHFEVC
ncbi:hypothetical protein AAE478_003838 [Parahypoxylon ruwenzoriense]